MLLYLGPHLPNLPVISAAAVMMVLHTLSVHTLLKTFSKAQDPTQSGREGELISLEQPSTNVG